MGRFAGFCKGVTMGAFFLLLLDAVLHLAAGAVQHLVQAPRVPRQIGHHETRVVSLRTVFGLDDHATRPVPASGRIAELPEEALWLAGHRPAGGGRMRPGHGEPFHPTVSCQTEDIADPVRLTPA